MPTTMILVLYIGLALAYGVLRWRSALSWPDVVSIALFWPVDMACHGINTLLEPVVASLTYDEGALE